MDAYRWLWPYLRKHLALLLAAFALVLLASMLNMVNPYVTGVIVDRVIVAGNPSLLPRFLVIMVAATLAKAVVRYVFQMVFEHVSQDTVSSMRRDLYRRLQGLDFTYFERTKTGDIMTRMTGDMDAVRHFVAWVVYMSFENGAIFVFSVAILFTINWELAAVLFALTPAVAWFAHKLAGTVRPTFLAIREQFARLNSVVQENIAGNRVIKAFARERFEIAKFEKENAAFRDRNLDSAAVWGRYIPIIDSLSSAFGIVTMLAGGIFVIRGWITLGELVTFSSFTWALINPMRIAGWLVNDGQRFQASAEKIMSLVRTTSRLEPPAAPVVRKVRGEVEFRRVSFTYGDEAVLTDVSFRVPAGGTVGIMGPTGSGKSTIAHLLCRFYDPASGEILVDGIRVQDYDLGCLRSQVGIAMQDVFLFSDTIEGNVAYGEPAAPVERVIDASRLADADGFIREFPEGYDTIVGERGVGLSGGQRQRLALAQAPAQRPSRGDPRRHHLERRRRDRARDPAVAAHLQAGPHDHRHRARISSVEEADVILVVIDGRIAERGTHAELVALGGYYSRVYAHQTGRVVPAGRAAAGGAVSAGDGRRGAAAR